MTALKARSDFNPAAGAPVLDASYSGERTLALAGTTTQRLDPRHVRAAYTAMRRLANTHGCHRSSCPHPDRAVHNADVGRLREWLEILGLRPYAARGNRYSWGSARHQRGAAR
jgi:hypothetical protein